MKFQLYATMTIGFRDAAKKQGTGAEVDELKRMLTETNPYLLALTGIVTILHMVYELLLSRRETRTPYVLFSGSRCWRSRMMSPTGRRRRRWSESPFER
jgi:hypothetical protein